MAPEPMEQGDGTAEGPEVGQNREVEITFVLL